MISIFLSSWSSLYICRMPTVRRPSITNTLLFESIRWNPLRIFNDLFERSSLNNNINKIKFKNLVNLIRIQKNIGYLLKKNILKIVIYSVSLYADKAASWAELFKWLRLSVDTLTECTRSTTFFMTSSSDDLILNMIRPYGHLTKKQSKPKLYIDSLITF